MGKIFCPNCGKEVEDTWKTCPYCGFDLTSIKKENAVEEKNKAQQPQPAPLSTPQPVPQTNSENATSSPTKKNKWVSIAIILLIIIIVVPLVAYFSTGTIQVIYHSVLHNNIKIYIDGNCKGEFPSDTYITFHWITPGSHTVEATTTGGTFLAQETVTVNPGQTTTVELSYLK